MIKNTNSEIIEGRVQEHDLQIRTVQRTESPNFGKEFISGTIRVATDDAGLNVVPVHYSYVTPTTKNNQPNSTFNNLKKIIETGKTVSTDGFENATIVKLTPSLALNDYYPNGQDEVMSIQRNEGGFCSILSNLHPEGERNKFTFDAFINDVIVHEPDEDNNVKEKYLTINCLVFDFKKAALPVKLVAKRPDVIKYFENLGVSKTEPVYMKLWGQIVNSTISVERRTEAAFGEDAVDISTRSIREWVITGGSTTQYDIDEELAGEIKKALEDRAIYLAEKKASDAAYAASRNAAPAPTVAPVAKEGSFNF